MFFKMQYVRPHIKPQASCYHSSASMVNETTNVPYKDSTLEGLKLQTKFENFLSSFM